MVQSNCLRCQGTQFEMVEAPDILNTPWKWLFVRCASCGGVVGVLEPIRNGEIINQLERAR